MDIPPLRGKQLAALRSVAITAGGLREGSFPSVMPLLVAMELIESRPVPRGRHGSGRAWFLTTAGRAAARAYGRDEA